jgi:hypothetical protein
MRGFFASTNAPLNSKGAAITTIFIVGPENTVSCVLANQSDSDEFVSDRVEKSFW